MANLYRGEEFVYRKATIGGVTKTWAEWCEEAGVDRLTVKNRMWHGKTFEVALQKPLKKGRDWWLKTPITINGETRTPDEWLALSGLSRMGAYQRLNRGMKLEEALTKPKHMNTADTVTATISGETRTIREWCKINGVKVKTAIENYNDTKDPVYAVTPRREKFGYRSTHRIERKGIGKVAQYVEDDLSIHPTAEIVEMCTNCPYYDCISTISKCLATKKMKEKGEIL